jgi:hypothetical protein
MLSIVTVTPLLSVRDVVLSFQTCTDPLRVPVSTAGVLLSSLPQDVARVMSIVAQTNIDLKLTVMTVDILGNTKIAGHAVNLKMLQKRFVSKKAESVSTLNFRRNQLPEQADLPQVIAEIFKQMNQEKFSSYRFVKLIGGKLFLQFRF